METLRSIPRVDGSLMNEEKWKVLNICLIGVATVSFGVNVTRMEISIKKNLN